MNEQEPQEKKKFQETLADFFSSSKGVAFLKLSGFMIFFLFVYLFTLIGPKQRPTNSLNKYYPDKYSSSSTIIKKDLTFVDYKEKLLTKDYTLAMIIVYEEKEKVIMLEKKVNEITFTVDSLIGGVKYYIVDGIVYGPDKKVNEDIVADLNSDYLDAEKVINLIKDYEAIISISKEGETTYSYQLPNKKVLISYTNQSYEIKITEEDVEYNMSYMF